MWLTISYFAAVYILFEFVTSQEVGHTFVKASLPQRFDINTCFPAQNLSQFVTPFLNTCGVTSAFGVRGFGECQGSCTHNFNCVALAYTNSDRMCTHCEQSSATDDGMNLPHRDVMLAVEAFQTYVNG